jgi:hypothetical protein
MINGRPTQAPLDRDQQKAAFAALKQSYTQEVPATPVFPIAAVKDFKLSQDDQLKALQAQFQERGLQPQVQKVEKQLEENKTTTTIQQFYCRHSYQAVSVAWMGIPVRYKVCQKCGLVK